MACIAFLCSLVFTGLVASFVPVHTTSSTSEQPDYHYVPFAGDAWGSSRA